MEKSAGGDNRFKSFDFIRFDFYRLALLSLCITPSLLFTTIQMGKRAEQTKKRKRAAGTNVHSIKDVTHVNDKDAAAVITESNDDQLISLDDLATTVLTLETLCEEPEELARKDVKDVKRAVYALQRVMADGMTLGEQLNPLYTLFSD